MTPRIPLAYTFGNHMHWVDMEWLWGYDVLPGSVDDMLSYCHGLGIKGGVNFDGIGYEKLAAESPEHNAKLRQAVQEGTIEAIGASYGQPYGLFHGGESNVRQRIYGIRAATRLLGKRPTTFWEEEFDCFPQLPQILAGCGFDAAALYFQWTWHTPEVPREDAPVVRWESPDGSFLLAATRNRLNLHQWPEDFRILLDDLAANPPATGDGPPPLVLQWLELMPTPDWMCRSELMAPMLKELQKDPRFDLQPTTLADYVRSWSGQDVPTRRYSPDQLWHGMTLGKYADRHPKLSAYTEHRLLHAEVAAAILGLFGRPYEPWDVYPTWELEEGWRNLLAAQHHDNHECQGLCGHVAEAQFAFTDILLGQSDPGARLAQRVGGNVTINRHGFDLDGVPAMGYRRDEVELKRKAKLKAKAKPIFDPKTGVLVLGEQSVEISIAVGGHRLPFHSSSKDNQGFSVMYDESCDGYLSITLCPETGDVLIFASYESDERLDPGFQGAATLDFTFPTQLGTIRADGPYHVHEVETGSSGQRKYPEGDWMTSPQWFESVSGAFTSHSIVDTGSLLIAHSGNQGWFIGESRLRVVLLAEDPWDEGKGPLNGQARFRLRPHSGMSKAEALNVGALLLGQHPEVQTDPTLHFPTDEPASHLPADFSACRVHAPNVHATAFYREQASYAKRDLPDYALPEVSHPYVLRLVEVEGIGGEVSLTLPGPIARAVKTTLMGEALEELSALADDPALLTSEPEKLQPFGIEAARLTLSLRPYEIATIYLDIVPGRKQFRDLDAKREIWATIHRTEEA